MTRRVAPLIAVLALLVVVGGAYAASLQLKTKGGYTPLEKWVTNHTSADVNLLVTSHGTRLSKLTGIFCVNNGTAPLNGQYAGYEMSIQLPHSIPISRSGHFSFNGTTIVPAARDESPYPVTAHLSLSGSFRAGQVVKLKTIAATGTASSNFCKAGPTHFKLVYSPAV